MKDTIKFKKLLLQGDHVASGAFSQVFKARYNQITVCVKRIRIKQANESTSIHREITLLRKSQHENVVKFIGHCENDKTFYIVTEWIEGGNLRQYLKDYLIELSWQVRVDIAKGIAIGLQFMHDRGILHRDIKSRNILIDRKKNKPKLCDFGFAAELSDADISNTTCGTGEWMAPELYNGAATNSDKIDIFSYGIVLVELITRKNIARDLPRSSASNYGLDIELLKLHTPNDCPPEFFDLAISCCHIEPQMRTAWPEVIRILDAISASLPPSCTDESDDDDPTNTGVTTDTNDGDDDGGDDDDDDDYYRLHSPPVSAPASPIQYISHQTPFFLNHHHQRPSTPQPSPGSSPTSSPLMRPKKTAALRLLSHNRSGNTSDSGSSSGGSAKGRLSSVSAVSTPTPSTSPPQSPLSTPRLRHPPPPLVVAYPLTFAPSLDSPNRTLTEPYMRRPPSASASALELGAASHDVTHGTLNVGSRTKDYARHLLRKLAPLRFVRSRSDPCITGFAVAKRNDGQGEIVVVEEEEERKVDVLRTSMILRQRKRRDTGESKNLPLFENKDEHKEQHKEEGDTHKEEVNKEAGEDKDQAREEEIQDSRERSERVYDCSPEAVGDKMEKANISNGPNADDILVNVRDDYEPDNARPLTVSKRKHKKPRILLSSPPLRSSSLS